MVKPMRNRVNTCCRWDWWVGLLASFALTACGGRSVLDDERAYGDGRVEGVDGREILPLGSSTIAGETNPTVGPGATALPTTGPTPTDTNPTTVTRPQPPIGPTTVNPTAMPTTTVVNTTTAVPSTGTPTTTAVPTMLPTSAAPTDTTEPLPPLVPFPPEAVAPRIPADLQNIAWQDPWDCYPAFYDRRDYCSLGFSCSGVDYGTANCSLSGGTWYCDCSANRGYGSISFRQDSVLEGEACRIAGALCISEWPEEQTGECYESNDQGLDYCNASTYCSQELTSEFVSAKKSFQDYTNCNHSSIGGQDIVSCGCSNSSLGEFSVAWDPGSSCLEAQEACASGIDPDSFGDVECQWNSSSSDLTSCSNIDRCTQAATAGGNPVGLVSYQRTYCYFNGQSAWDCTCNYGNTTRYSADNAQEACEVAAVDCAEALRLSR